MDQPLVHSRPENTLGKVARFEQFLARGSGNQFTLFLDMLMIDRSSGTATPFSEIAVFTVRNAQIAEERYFHD